MKKVLSICINCNNVVFYNLVYSSVGYWGNLLSYKFIICDICGYDTHLCFWNTRNKKPIGFSKKCKRCKYRFICASVDIKTIETALVPVVSVKNAWYALEKAWDKLEKGGYSSIR